MDERAPRPRVSEGRLCSVPRHPAPFHRPLHRKARRIGAHSQLQLPGPTQRVTDRTAGRNCKALVYYRNALRPWALREVVASIEDQRRGWRTSIHNFVSYAQLTLCKAEG